MYSSRLAHVTSTLYDMPIALVKEKIIKLPNVPIGKIEENFPKQDKDIVTCDYSAKNGFNLEKAVQILKEIKLLSEFKSINSSEEIKALEIEEVNPGLFTLRINANTKEYKGTLILDIMMGKSGGEAFIVEPQLKVA